MRWVRAKGKVFFNIRKEPVRFIGSVLDITDQKREEQRKNDFIGMVSHELKTPLTSMKLYSQMLHKRAQQQNDTFTIPALEQVDKQVRKMTGMINGFLNLSRLESGQLHVELQDVDLNTLIYEAIEDVKHSGATHEISFTSAAQLTVDADRQKIEQVLSNLLSNAIKYSPEGKLVHVETRREGDMAVVSIKDYGIGIDDRDIGKLFERYYRVEGSDAKYVSGFGIGLYLSAQIIERHHGKIWVESARGKGSTFYFSLPLAGAM
jgi:signal transduction histidine kinase